MAMTSTQKGNGAARKRRGRKFVPMSEINVTPFVDVMLVLLIVFMVTAPLLLAGIPLDLPTTKAQNLNADTQPISISIKPASDGEALCSAGGRIYIQETEIEQSEISARLQAIASNRQGEETRILLRGDRAIGYEIVSKVMGEIKAAGFNKITMVTLPENDG